MESSKAFYRKASAECPVSVYYYTPSYVPQKPQPLHRSLTFMVLLMHTGQVEFYTTGGMLTLTAGDICLVPPRLLHAFRSSSLQTNYTLFCMGPDLFSLPAANCFSREFWQPLQSGQLHIPQLLHPGEDPHGALAAQMQRLDVEKEGTAAYTLEIMSIAMNICTALFPYCSREAAPQAVLPDGQSVSDQCIQYIRNNYQQKITLEDIARHVHLHPNYVCALFREQTGKTVFEYLNWYRVHYATKLLRSSNFPIAQVAAQCGFQNQTFFARKFKQITSRTPTAYRKQSRNK